MQRPVIEIHSNVVPRQAYLTRLQGMQATCSGHLCSGGFFPSSVLREGEPPRQSCANCALTEQLKGKSHMGAEQFVKFWYMEEKDVMEVDDHGRVGRGNEGEVYKILWHKGVFARK